MFNDLADNLPGANHGNLACLGVLARLRGDFVERQKEWCQLNDPQKRFVASKDIRMAMHLDAKWTADHIDYCVISLLRDRVQLLDLIKKEELPSAASYRLAATTTRPGSG